jgi:pilus assembly protein CpaB
MGDGQRSAFLAGAIGLALLAAIFAFASLRIIGGDGGGSSSGPRTDVVVTSRAIGAGEVVSGDMLQVATVPEDLVPANAITSLDGLEGLVVRYPLEEGEQLTPAKLGQECPSGGDVGCVVPLRQRGFPVGVTEEKIFGGLLAPGDRVDVIAIGEAVEDDVRTPKAKLLVQNAEVLAVADTSLESVATSDRDGNPLEGDASAGVLATSPEDPDAQPDARSVTLAVTPEEAMLIALAQEEGAVWLSIRGANDDEIREIPSQSLTFE